MDAATATKAVVGVLTERLTPGEAHDLVTALPQPLHEMLDRHEGSRARVVERIDRAELLARLAARLAITPAHAEAIAVVVLAALREELPVDVAAHVASQLPRDIKSLWLATRPVAPPPGAMSASGARALVERDVAQRARLPRGITATAAVTAVVAAFAERLSGGEARDFLLGLPDELRPMLEEPVRNRSEPARVFGRDELVARVADALTIDLDDAERLVAVVLGAIKGVLPVKEIDDVTSQLPDDLRELWLAA